MPALDFEDHVRTWSESKPEEVWGEKEEAPILHQKIVEEIADHELPEQSHGKKDDCPRPSFCQHSR